MGPPHRKHERTPLSRKRLARAHDQGGSHEGWPIQWFIDKRDADDEYGIVMLADIAREVLAKDRAPERVNVYEIMSKPALTVHPDMDIRYCARLFERFGLARAPVTKQGKIVGIVSYTDMVLKGLARDL